LFVERMIVMSKRTFEIQKVVVVKEKLAEYEAFKEPVKCSADIARISRELNIDISAEELFCMFCINAKGQIVAFHEVSHGDLCSSTTHPREIFKRAILNNAGSMIFVHNHPSGDPEPSEMDVETTKRLVECGDMLGIPVLDHIILGEDEYISMKAKGRAYEKKSVNNEEEILLW